MTCAFYRMESDVPQRLKHCIYFHDSVTLIGTKVFSSNPTRLSFVRLFVFVNKPAMIPAPNLNIRTAIAEIQPHLYKSVIEEVTKRVVSCQWGPGWHLADIIFHTQLLSLCLYTVNNKVLDFSIFLVLSKNFKLDHLGYSVQATIDLPSC